MIYLVSNTKKEYDDVCHLPVCKIEYIYPDILFDNYNDIILTSKNAIACIEYFNINLPKDLIIHTISKHTYMAAKEYGFLNVIPYDSKNWIEFTNKLILSLKFKKVLYLRSEQVAGDLFLSLKNAKIDIDEIVTYRNIPMKVSLKSRPKSGDIIIFASPLNFNFFYKTFGWESDFVGIAIGSSTNVAMAKFGIKALVPNSPSIDECVKLARLVNAGLY